MHCILKGVNHIFQLLDKLNLFSKVLKKAFYQRYVFRIFYDLGQSPYKHLKIYWYKGLKMYFQIYEGTLDELRIFTYLQRNLMSSDFRLTYFLRDLPNNNKKKLQVGVVYKFSFVPFYFFEKKTQ